jgi:hypothetical protein
MGVLFTSGTIERLGRWAASCTLAASLASSPFSHRADPFYVANDISEV